MASLLLLSKNRNTPPISGSKIIAASFSALVVLSITSSPTASNSFRAMQEFSLLDKIIDRA
jgi:hypothetical protein